MRLDEMVESPPEAEYEAADGDVEADLNEALELLTDAVTLFDRLLRKRNRRVGVMDEKEIDELANEINGFLSQWTGQPLPEVIDSL